jgi:hypothetical protein
MNTENVTDVSNAYISAKIGLMAKETTEYSEELYLLRYNAIQSNENQWTFLGSMLPPTSKMSIDFQWTA